MDWKPARLKKEKGQHFITDREILAREARALAGIEETEKNENGPGAPKSNAQSLFPPHAQVLEIGAGDGRLSEQLMALKPEKLVLVEPDARWASKLMSKFSPNPRVLVRARDILDLNDKEWANVQYVAGNIPYHITSGILLMLGRLGGWKRSVLCIQKEVAGRLLAPAGSHHYGRMSVFCQLHFEIKPLEQVPAHKFHPVPKVDSTVILLRPKEDAKNLPPNLEEVSAALFSHRLASVANAVLHSRKRWGWGKGEARAVAKRLKWADEKVFRLAPNDVVLVAREMEKMTGEKPDAAAEGPRAAGGRKKTG